MYSTLILPIMRRHFNRIRFLGCNPLEFESPTSDKLIKVKSRKKLYIQCFISLFYCLVLLLILIWGQFPIPEKLQGFVFLTCNFIFLAGLGNPNLDIEPIQIANSFVSLEDNLLKPGIIRSFTPHVTTTLKGIL